MALNEVLGALLSASAAGGFPYLPAETPPEPESIAVSVPVAGYGTDELEHAATIVVVGRQMGVPQQGQVVALATAMQESGLRNLDYGHSDSLGLFQQRPSMGWGNAAEVRTPEYAARQFYIALLEVPDWQNLPVTEAAQAVQASAYPHAYAKHEQTARRLLAALGGGAA